jgi:hypothetical protein
VLFADPVSGANDAGGRDRVRHVVHERCGLVERERGAEIGAMFSGDLLQTRPDSTASIQSNGSNVMVLADSLVKFEGTGGGTGAWLGARDDLARTGGACRRRDGEASGHAWTEFQVTDVDGRVQIAANKGDVTVQDDKGTTTVAQGQQTTRDDTTDTEKKKKKAPQGGGAATAATGGIMSSTPVVTVGWLP